MEWHPKQRKADDETSAGTNMVLVLPTEFGATGLHEAPSFNDCERINVIQDGTRLVSPTDPTV
jgi:hypothetical protein